MKVPNPLVTVVTLGFYSAQERNLRTYSVLSGSTLRNDMKFSAIGLATCFALITSPSFAQMSGGSSTGGASGGSLSSGSTTIGPGGSNTANALSRGSSGNAMGATQTNPSINTPLSSGNAVNTPAANSAVNSLPTRILVSSKNRKCGAV